VTNTVGGVVGGVGKVEIHLATTLTPHDSIADLHKGVGDGLSGVGKVHAEPYHAARAAPVDDLDRVSEKEFPGSAR